MTPDPNLRTAADLMPESDPATDALLDRRAKQLAQTQTLAAGVESLQAIRFRINGQKYAIESSPLERVVPASFPTPVPGSATHVRGVVLIEGSMIAAVDLTALLGIGVTEQYESLLVVSDEGRRVAIMASEILDFIGVESGDLLPIPATLAHGNGYLSHMVDDHTALIDHKILLQPTDPAQGS